MRREKVLTSVNIRANRQGWDKTRRLLKAVTTADIEKAIQDERVHRRITNEGVKTLLKEVGSISMAAPGSDEKKGYALTDLKSSFVYYGTPTIYLTINPADRYSPFALLYAGVTIDPKRFIPEEFSYTERVSVLLLNPLAVIEYFHNMVSTVIETVIKRGMFGKVVHHYGTIEYQGRGTPHMHMAVSPIHRNY
jgi:Helitron helicase-like domain at N-terminus